MKGFSEEGPRAQGGVSRRSRWRGAAGRLGKGGPAGAGGAFTLVELLVVVSIIALLVTMLAPSLSRAMALVRRAKCATNLNGMAKALVLYGTEHNSYPHVPLNGAGWDAAIGSSRDVNPFAGDADDRNPTSCLYVLVREGLCGGGMFICPSTRDKPSDEWKDHWDFADGKAVSYALMNPYGPRPCFDGAVAGNVPILADSSPYFDADTGLRNDELVVDLANADEKQAEAGNSPNHRHEGQNVTAVDGSTTWKKRADVGSEQDNIYTRSDEADGTDSRGSIPDPAGDGSAEDQGPAGPCDSYLVP